ncbi:MAG: transporter [Hydrogenophaga sp.]|uniref:SphA family protein n=1 Tax=Hydrogenophaga sp. TaxID=1904254 RepID=UPI002717E6DB|nr:transporter [Hydrogenophaga sp.]MDO9029574.1 transporter [Hydrogenophaga sp.]
MQLRSTTRRATALAAALAALTLGFTGTAQATEGGGTTAAAGAEGFLAGALPPPGTYGLVYATHYSASRFNDGDGNTAIPGFKVKANVLVGRLVHMTSSTVLGGQLGYYGVLPLVDLKVNAAGASDSRTGAGDIEVAPLLAWHGPQWHTAAGMALVLPTGSYDKARMANPGNNITTLRPVFVASYLTATGLDLSTKLTYSINRKNSDTNYQSGQYLHADFNAGMRVAPAWQVGLQGYLIHQTTDDKVNGVKVGSDGNRTRVFAFGPAVRWQNSPTAPSVELRLLKETGARNHTQGTAMWLKAVWAL